MDFISVFFILISVCMLVYVFYTFKSSKRLPMILEIFFLGIYGLVFVIFLFPDVLNLVEDLTGIASAINFLVYLSIFVAYFLIFILYRKDESQRVEISALNRELAFTRKKIDDMIKTKKK